MKESFLTLFFAKPLILAHEPLDIRSTVSFGFEELLSVIISGAEARIDVFLGTGAQYCQRG